MERRARRPAKRVLVGIAGGSASGKTTLVAALSTLLSGRSVSLLRQDDYYVDRPDLRPEERACLNFDQPSALDNKLLARHLRALVRGEPVDSPCYCFRTHLRLPDTRRVDPAEIVIVEGMHLLRSALLRSLFDVRIFVDAPADVRLARRILRDTGPERARSTQSIVDQYLTHVRPMHERHVEPSKRHADTLVTDAADPAQARRVAALIRHCLPRRAPVSSPTECRCCTRR
jgi:uridine kinase